MRYRFTADIEFDAEDLDEAFVVLAKHFLNLSTHEIGHAGELSIEPVEEEKIAYG